MMISAVRSRYYAIVDTGLWSDYGVAIKAITDPESLTPEELTTWNRMLSEHGLVDPPPSETVTASAEDMLAAFTEEFHGNHNQKSHGRRGNRKGTAGNDASGMEWREVRADGNNTFRSSFTSAGGHKINVYRDSAESDTHDLERVSMVTGTVADLADKYGVTPPAITIGHDSMVLAMMETGDGQFSVEAARKLATQTLSEEHTSAFVAAFRDLNGDKQNMNLGINESIMQKGNQADEHYAETDADMFNEAIYGFDTPTNIKYTVTHEYGHVLYNQAEDRFTSKQEIAYHEAWKKQKVEFTQDDSPYGTYAFFNKDEFAAESFAIREFGLDIDGRAQSALEWIS